VNLTAKSLVHSKSFVTPVGIPINRFTGLGGRVGAACTGTGGSSPEMVEYPLIGPFSFRDFSSSVKQ
jgi:hypothetical protein